MNQPNRQDDHVRIDMTKGTFFCDHCRAEEAFTLPIAISKFVKLGKAFGRKHNHCKPPDHA